MNKYTIAALRTLCKVAISIFLFNQSLVHAQTQQPPAQNPTPVQAINKPAPADSIALLQPMPELPKIEFTENFETIYAHQGPTFRVNIPSGDPVKVEKSWLKYLKNYGGKTKGTKAEYYTGRAYIIGVSDDPVNIYSKIEGYPNGAYVKVQIDMGGNNYVTSKSEESKVNAIKRMLTDFAISESAKGISAKLAAEEKQLLALDKQRIAQKNTEKDILAEIIDLKASLERAESRLNQNKEEQNKLSLDLKKQINTIEYLKNSLRNIAQQK